MFRSIQILRLSSELNNTTIRELFEKKSFKYKKKHKITGEPLDLDVEVINFKDKYNPKTIHIDFEYHYQFLINRDAYEKYIIVKELFHVIIFPKEKLLILLGSGSQRNPFQKFLREKIKLETNCTLETLRISIPKMMSIFKNIQKESVRNNIRRPKFYFDRADDFYKIEESMYSAFANTCASKIKEFEFNKLNASKMDLSLRIVKCTGLIPTELSTHYILNIVHDGRMSITVNVEPKQWAKFIYEKVYPILS
jgi:hypothetical protein